MALSAEIKCWPPLPLGGSRDVLALALDGANRLRHDHQPNQHRARRQAVPRLVGSYCRQSDLRRTVGVALLVSRCPSRISPQIDRRNIGGGGKKKKLANFDEPRYARQLLHSDAKHEHCLPKTPRRQGARRAHSRDARLLRGVIALRPRLLSPLPLHFV
jgi:hypothetical protein